MNFLLDHDVPDRTYEVLLRANHGPVRLREILPMNTADAAVLAEALERQLILVTCNRDDFLGLAKIQEHFGIIILLRRKSRIAECSALLKFLQKSGEAGLIRNINFA